MISVAASSYFTRTVAVAGGLLPDDPAAGAGRRAVLRRPPKARFRLVLLGGVLSRRAAWWPASCCSAATSRRLLHPPDVGAEAKDVVDPDLEQRTAVGMVIRSDQFPDRLFAPPKRTDLMADDLNPVYDKEMRSELFGQGTLMLRLVIQLSMFLALPLMAVCLYIWPQLGPLVHQLRAAVQHAGRPGLLGRQRHQRARAADARTAADHHALALADPLGQAALQPAGLVRADQLPGLAAAAGLAPAALDLLGRHAHHARLPGDHRW